MSRSHKIRVSLTEIKKEAWNRSSKRFSRFARGLRGRNQLFCISRVLVAMSQRIEYARKVAHKPE